MTTAVNVAIIGATGAVGREMLKDLEESNVEGVELSLYASQRSAGEAFSFRGRTLEVKPYMSDHLRGTDFVLMSAGGAFSKEHAKTLVEQGAVVIDNSSAWRMDEDALLIVPEVNGDELKSRRPQIIANPNCSTIQLVVALKPLKDQFGLELVQVATYQSVSGTGQKGVAELGRQVEAHFKFQDPEPQVYAQPIAFNLLPGIDVFDEAGHCYEEVKMVRETRKIMRLPHLGVLASTVRVPTFNCHGEMVTVRLAEDVTREQVLAAFEEGEGLVLNRSDDHQHQPTPRQVVGDGRVFVSRVRLPWGEPRSPWLQFWNVADNLKKGAATNAVQIFERMARL